jgi:threonine/homoserine/homoserine lactone efflux protein
VPQDPLVFVGIAALLTITPGADMAMVSRSVLIGGRREAFATTLGILEGCLVWAIVSAAGVAAVLAASRTAYDALRLAGAAYLIWLGAQSLLAARRRGHHRYAAQEAGTAPRRSPFRQASSRTSSTRRSRSSTRPSCRSSSAPATPHCCSRCCWPACTSASAWSG